MKEANELKELGNREVEKKNYGKAAEMYTRALRLHADPVFFANRALCRFHLRQLPEALEDARAATQLDPRYWKGYLRASQVLIAQGRFDEGIAVLRQAKEVLPEEVHVRRELEAAEILQSYAGALDAHFAAGEWSDVVRKVDALLEKVPPNAALVRRKILALCFGGDLEKARTALQTHESVLRSEELENYYVCRATLERLSNNFAQSSEAIAEGVRRFPTSIALNDCRQLIARLEAAKELGNRKFAAGELDAALKAYSDALEIDPPNKKFNAVLCSNMASCLMKKNKMREALTQARAATELDPTFAKAFAKRGEIEKALGEAECALNSLNRAKQLDSSLQLEAKIKAAAAEAKKAAKKDFYEILGVDKKCSADELKKAYKKLVYKYHPDKNAGSREDLEQAEKRFKQITEAYEVLGDPEKRRRYDLGIGDEGEGFGGRGAPPGFDMNDIFGGSEGTTSFKMFFSPGSSNTFNLGGGARRGNAFGGIDIEQLIRQFGARR